MRSGRQRECVQRLGPAVDHRVRFRDGDRDRDIQCHGTELDLQLQPCREPCCEHLFQFGRRGLHSGSTVQFHEWSTGPYAGQLCIIDLAGLTTNDLAVAGSANACYNVSVAVQSDYILHFCLNISSTVSGESVLSDAVPTDTDAGFGKTVYPGSVGQTGALHVQLPEHSNV